MDLCRSYRQLAKKQKSWLVREIDAREQQEIGVLGVEDALKRYPGAALIPLCGRQQSYTFDVTRPPRSRERKMSESSMEDTTLAVPVSL